MKNQLEFQYDTLVDRGNFCNRKSEITLIQKMLSRHQKVIIYAPRRSGKTSLMENIIAEDFLAKNKKGVVISVDFMDVVSLLAIEQRLTQSISKVLVGRHKARGYFEALVGYFKSMSLSIDVDPISGQPSVSFRGQLGQERKTIEDFFSAVMRIAKDRPVLLIMDEFQDICQVAEAEAIIRKGLQHATTLPVLISGSKRNLLSQMFASSKAPFFGFGDEITLAPISEPDWFEYFNARLTRVHKSIDLETMSLLCKRLCHVPNAISHVGFWLKYDEELAGRLGAADVMASIGRLVFSKQQMFRYHLAPFSIKERSILAGIAKHGYVTQPTAMVFLKIVSSNASSVRKTLAKLEALGTVEWEIDKGYRLSDPLLSLFLSQNNLG